MGDAGFPQGPPEVTQVCTCSHRYGRHRAGGVSTACTVPGCGCAYYAAAAELLPEPAVHVTLPIIVVGAELVVQEHGAMVGAIHIRCECGAILKLGIAPTIGDVGQAAERHRREYHQADDNGGTAERIAAGDRSMLKQAWPGGIAHSPHTPTPPAPAELPAEHLGATCPCWTMVGGPRNHQEVTP